MTSDSPVTETRPARAAAAVRARVCRLDESALPRKGNTGRVVSRTASTVIARGARRRGAPAFYGLTAPPPWAGGEVGPLARGPAATAWAAGRRALRACPGPFPEGPAPHPSARGRRGHRVSVPAMTADPAAAARTLLEGAVARRVTPGAVLHATARDGRELRLAVGRLTYDEGAEPVTEDTVYDLASLTKVVACLPLLLHLLAEGEVRLGDKVSRFFSNAGWFQERSLGDVTIEDLALHRSGLPAWRPVFANVSTRLTAVANVLQTPLTEEPGRFVYSDLGVIVLGAVVERVIGERSGAAFRRV